MICVLRAAVAEGEYLTGRWLMNLDGEIIIVSACLAQASL
jgi:hypothetical protein